MKGFVKLASTVAGVVVAGTILTGTVMAAPPEQAQGQAGQMTPGSGLHMNSTSCPCCANASAIGRQATMSPRRRSYFRTNVIKFVPWILATASRLNHRCVRVRVVRCLDARPQCRHCVHNLLSQITDCHDVFSHLHNEAFDTV